MSRNSAFIVIFAAASIVVGLALSISLHDVRWLARAGAIVSTLGVLLVSQAALLAERVKSDVIHPESGRSAADPEHYQDVGQKVPDWVEKDVRVRYAVAVLGPLLSAIGTLIWAFADLIPFA